MKEKWSRFYDYYEVSNTGKIRSIDRTIERKSFAYGKNFKRFYKGKVLRLHFDKNGHFQVKLYNREGEPKIFFLHSLVMEHFGPPKPEGYIIGYLDGNKKNVCADNLVWVSRVYVFSKAGRIKLDTQKVKLIRKRLAMGLSCQKIADEFGVSRGAISAIKLNRNWAINER